MSAHESFKMAAGVGYPVDLMKGVGEIGNSRRSSVHGRRAFMDAGSGSALLLAESETPLYLVAPCNPQATGYRSIAQHLHCLDRPAD